MTQIAVVEHGDFRLEANRESSRILATLTGTADQSVTDDLDKALQSIHETAKSGVTEAVVDLRKLEFMNSSCLKALLTWINDIQELEPAHRYQVRFISDANIHWQKRSLHSVRCFASELITITYE